MKIMMLAVQACRPRTKAPKGTSSMMRRTEG